MKQFCFLVLVALELFSAKKAVDGHEGRKGRSIPRTAINALNGFSVACGGCWFSAGWRGFWWEGAERDPPRREREGEGSYPS